MDNFCVLSQVQNICLVLLKRQAIDKFTFHCWENEHEVEIVMYEGVKFWMEKYYNGKIPNVQKRKTELVKLTAEKYNLQQEYQKVKASVEERKKMLLERQINVRNRNERNNCTRHNQKQDDWIR